VNRVGGAIAGANNKQTQNKDLTMRTNPSERRRRQRLNRLSRKVVDALVAGATLHFMHTETGPRWRLSTGRHVCADVAQLVIANTSVASNNDALFPDAKPQTFRSRSVSRCDLKFTGIGRRRNQQKPPK
jgi:hypothetical protein